MYKSNNNFIVIEGCEGAGKTTLLNTLKETLANEFRDIITNETLFTREPGGTPLMAEIRKIILDNPNAHTKTLAMLFAASRMDNLLTNISPALKEGKLVISDRYMMSSLAWQGENYMDMKLIEEMENMIQEYVPTLEDLNPTYIFLDIEPEVGLARKKDNDQELTEFDKVDITRHKKIRDRYHSVINSGIYGNMVVFKPGSTRIKDVSDAGCFVIDANTDIQTLCKTVVELILMLKSAESSKCKNM
ncbi:MAG: dTMP kinase [Cetobacterium sp.]|uniref:dTMP kinase n=1 Tax=Cetobacterium sp. TaxID=2071632 RepID=UPI003F419044